MEQLVARLESDECFRRVLQRLAADRGASVGGLWGSSVAVFLAALSRHAPTSILVVVPSVEDAEQLIEDARLFGESEPALFPALESSPTDDAFPGQLHSQRLGLLRRLAAGGEAAPALILAPVQAVMQPVPDAGALAAATLELRTGGRHRLEALAEWLVDRGLERVPMVEGAGQFSIRGGILDVFALAAAKPVRIEFFGDEVESIRSFDIESQRSDAKLDACEIVALTARHITQSAQAGPRSLIDELAEGSWVCLHEPLEVQARAERTAEQLGEQGGLLAYDTRTRRPSASASARPRASTDSSRRCSRSSGGWPGPTSGC